MWRNKQGDLEGKIVDLKKEAMSLREKLKDKVDSEKFMGLYWEKLKYLEFQTVVNDIYADKKSLRDLYKEFKWVLIL